MCVCVTNKIVELAVSQNALCDDRRFVDEGGPGTLSSYIGRDGKQIKGMFLGLIRPVESISVITSYSWLYHMTFSLHLETWQLETFLNNEERCFFCCCFFSQSNAKPP